MAADKKLELVKRWVCDACGGIYFQPILGKCPGCKGTGRERDVVYDAAGAARVAE